MGKIDDRKTIYECPICNSSKIEFEYNDSEDINGYLSIYSVYRCCECGALINSNNI